MLLLRRQAYLFHEMERGNACRLSFVSLNKGAASLLGK